MTPFLYRNLESIDYAHKNRVALDHIVSLSCAVYVQSLLRTVAKVFAILLDAKDDPFLESNNPILDLRITQHYIGYIVGKV